MFEIDGAEKNIKPETLFWRNVVRPALAPFGIIKRVENAIDVGFPDVVYCLHRGDNVGVSGWIELKHAYALPARNDTIFRFKHFTVDQANFLESWGGMKQRACVLAQIGDIFVLVPSQHCVELQRGVTAERLHQIAAVTADFKFPTGRILRWLTSRA